MTPSKLFRTILPLLMIATLLVTSGEALAKKKVVFMAGVKSHGYGSHEHYAGCVLLAKSLQASMPDIEVVVYRDGWPSDPKAFDDADAIVMYCDGGARHPVNDHLQQIDRLAKKGVGIVCLHYGVEIPKGEAGDRLLDWIGGYFEADWSVNPHWTAKFDNLPNHPITRGVKPFEINDEWYYHMRFLPDMKGITPILTDLPPVDSLSRPDGAHSGNPHVRAAVLNRKEPQHVAWALQRDNGGRGFGFTGGHFHWNWGDDNFRKLVLNAIVWTAQAEVPAEGVSDAQQTIETLEQNQDYDPPKNFNRKVIRKRFNLKSKPDQGTSTDEPHDVHDADRAVAGLDVAPGLVATLVASEPMIHSLTNLDVDHLGRIWVCDVVNYRSNQGQRPKGDKILILEDTDRDGKADKSTTFYQGHEIDSAMGICVLGNRVIVSNSPDVFIFTDDDGDGRADRHELLFTGIYTGRRGDQHDHTVHAFVFGPDGKLYFNFGNVGKQIKDSQGRPIIDMAGNEVNDQGKPYRQGMVFRCNQDGSDFEVVGNNFRNNYEVAVDSFGTMWQSDNDDDGNKGVRINFVMEFGDYGYVDQRTGDGWKIARTGMSDDIPTRHWHQNDPGVMPNLLQTGQGSPTGILVYEGNLLPKMYRNQLIHCDAGPNVVRAYPAKRDGAGYRAEMVNILHGARDNWFRPSDVCVAPDGSLMVADWYDPGVGGHRQGDVDRGRLFRVAPKGHRYRVPEFDFTTAAGAIKALNNPNHSARYLAWTALHQMGSKAEPELLRQFTDAKGPRARARALWLLGKIEGRGEHFVEQAIQDKNPNIRIVGLRLARQLKIDMIPILQRLVADRSSQVRRECAIALRHNSRSESAQLWAELAAQHDGQDRWYLEALGIAADRQWDSFLNAWLDRVGAQWNTPEGRDIIWRSRAAKSPSYLVEIMNDQSVAVADLPRYFRAFDFLEGREKEAAITNLAFTKYDGNSARTNYIIAEAMSRLEPFDMRKNPQKADALNQILNRIEDRSQFITLVSKFNVVSRYGELLTIAQGDPQGQVGIEAIRALLAKNQADLIRGGLTDKDPQVAIHTIQALGGSDDGRALGLLIPIIKNGSDSELRRQATRAAARSTNGANRLIAMAKAGELDEILKAAAAFQLNASPSRQVRAEAAKLFPLPLTKNNRKIPPIRDLLKQKGDASRGQIVFSKTGECSKCHIVNRVGKEVGPDLSEIGSKLSRQAFFESIIYPSAGISHNYETYALALNNGNIVTGILVSDTGDSITLKSIDAIVRTYKKSEIDELKKLDISTMPADLQKTMTTQDLLDVVDYLTTLKKAK